MNCRERKVKYEWLNKNRYRHIITHVFKKKKTTTVGYLGFNSLDRISLKEYLFFHSPLIEFTFVETK